MKHFTLQRQFLPYTTYNLTQHLTNPQTVGPCDTTVPPDPSGIGGRRGSTSQRRAERALPRRNGQRTTRTRKAPLQITATALDSITDYLHRGEPPCQRSQDPKSRHATSPPVPAPHRSAQPRTATQATAPVSRTQPSSSAAALYLRPAPRPALLRREVTGGRGGGSASNGRGAVSFKYRGSLPAGYRGLRPPATVRELGPGARRS